MWTPGAWQEGAWVQGAWMPAVAPSVHIAGQYVLTIAESRTVSVRGVFYIKRGDRWPAFEATLAKKDGGPLGFTAGDIAGVRFLMAPEKSTQAIVDAPVTSYFVQNNALSVVYEWAEGDTDLAKNCWAEIEVEFIDGRRVTFPNNGYIQVVVTGDLG